MNKTSKTGIDLIKRFEGKALKAYWDVDAWAIGYGNRDGVHEHMTISEAEAEARLIQDLTNTEREIYMLVKVELNQNQHDALVSWYHNFGYNNFKTSTLLKVINRGDFAAVPFQLNRWIKVKIDGVLTVSDWQVKRRQAEATLFAKPVDMTPIPKMPDQTKWTTRDATPTPVREERESISSSRTMKSVGGAASTGILGVLANKFEVIIDALPSYADDVLFFMALGFVAFIGVCRWSDWKKAQS